MELMVDKHSIALHSRRQPARVMELKSVCNEIDLLERSTGKRLQLSEYNVSTDK